MKIAYQQGVYDEIIMINQNSVVPIISNSSGNITIENVNIRKICEGLK